MDEAQEMVQLISGQSNGKLYTGGGTELNRENKYEFFKVRVGRRVFPAEGTCGQRVFQRVWHFMILGQVQSDWSLRHIWQNGES